jgi:hypothetical protein
MPFDDKEYTPKAGIKPIVGQKSMFEGKPRPPTQQEFDQQVRQAEDKKQGYNRQAAELFVQFNKVIADKTLPQNRNVFNNETENELLKNMLRFASAANNDTNELEGEGSLALITILLKACLAHRDRINELEYALSVLQKKEGPGSLADLISKEIAKALDTKKPGG